MKTDKQIKIGSILSYTQMIAGVVIGLIYTPMMIRLLGDSEYGLYNTVSSVISMLSVLSLGFNSCYIKFFAKYKQEDDKDKIAKLNGLFLIIFLCIGAIALLCGLFLSFHLELVFDKGLTAKEYEIAKILMLLLTLNLAISFPMSVFSNIISAHEKFIFLKLLAIGKTVFGPFLTIPLLLSGYGSIAVVSVTLFVAVAIDTAYFFFVRKKLDQKFVFHGFEKGIFKELFVYTAFVAIHIVVDQVNWNVGKVLLGRFKGTEAVAVYSVGFTMYTYFMSIGLPIASMFAPRVHKIIADENASNKREELTGVFVGVGRVQWLILSLILTGFLFFGKPFIYFWAGEGYEQAYYVALLLMIAGTPDLIQNVGIEIQRAQNLHRFRAVAYLIMAIVNVVISIFLCQKYGVVGTAIGTALSLIVVQGVIINIYYHKKCNLDIITFWKNILQIGVGVIIPCIVGVVINLVVNLYSIWGLLFGIICYVIIYGISIYFLGMNQEEKEFINKPLRKIGCKLRLVK